MSTSINHKPDRKPIRKRVGADGPTPDEMRSENDQSAGAQAEIDSAVEKPEHSPRRPWLIERRDEMLNDHPVVKGNYTVPTPMLIHAHEEARDRVWSRRTGVVFYGETRAGKTTCAASIRDYLKDEFDTIYIVMASGRRLLRPKEGHMSRLILEGSGHILANRADPDALLRNVNLDVMTNVANLGGDQFVLLLDEVNLCNECDLTELLEIHNMLWLKGIKMTTLSFGQPEIISLITSLRETRQNQIIARFFRKPIPFLCCNSEQALAAVLHCLDEDTEWPEGSGWTFTYFFFPKAFANGFRLEKYSASIWSALVNALPGQPTSFTMEAIALTINGLYLGTRDADRDGLVLTDQDISRALASADI